MKSEKQIPATAADWIAQLADGELSAAQRAALADWLRESPTHVRELLDLNLIHQELAALPLAAEQVDGWVREARSAASGLSILGVEKESIAASKASGLAQAIQRSRARWLPRFAVAASLVGVVFASVVYLSWQSGRYSTDFGEQKIVTLADGSVVTLNTSSKLKVRFSGTKRSIKLLQGEAFFRVAPDSARPFEVAAQEAMVRAIGTQFNVRIAREDTIVSVIDGRVAVSVAPLASSAQGNAAIDARPGDGLPASHGYADARGASSLTLSRGEEARIARQENYVKLQATPMIKASHVPALSAAAWIKGRVEFEDAPLSEVLEEFRRYREFKVEIEDDSIRQLKLTGSFDAQDPESALAYIGTLPGIVTERKQPQTFVIRRR